MPIALDGEIPAPGNRKLYSVAGKLVTGKDDAFSTDTISYRGWGVTSLRQP